MEEAAAQADPPDRIARRPESVEIAAHRHRQHAMFLMLDFGDLPALRSA